MKLDNLTDQSEHFVLLVSLMTSILQGSGGMSSFLLTFFSATSLTGSSSVSYTRLLLREKQQLMRETCPRHSPAHIEGKKIAGQHDVEMDRKILCGIAGTVNGESAHGRKVLTALSYPSYHCTGQQQADE
ncbi:hypothetical protein PMW_181 [Pseudomonas phage phiPMW]|uniref:Uncharacterized protein n=1 Tax=Pseudomonas phage phiPMW TaxID=1815582 RepID=A0A1S5R1M8_9CAUD|nr:hypothetical protein FDG97_gp169 [Pseudomonas phage phiPMW]ANA49306.1 hypothetical protein PMW_181 [Pseudomonas phage phiPMW]